MRRSEKNIAAGILLYTQSSVTNGHMDQVLFLPDKFGAGMDYKNILHISQSCLL